MTYGHHRATWVTRKPKEQWDETTTRDRVQMKAGWMFWESFANDKRVSVLDLLMQSLLRSLLYSLMINRVPAFLGEGMGYD